MPASNPSPVATENPAPTLVYPISNFSVRAAPNLFGTYFVPGGRSNPDELVCPNATYYSGHHTAVDLETTVDDANNNVPVFAIAAGTVRSIGLATGYGGLIIVQYNLGDSDYTGIYGHIDLSTAKVRKDNKVTVGKTLASLGLACSSINGNVRKHLHFGLHKGSSVDVRGYVQTKSLLSEWVDPQKLLSSLGASQ